MKMKKIKRKLRRFLRRAGIICRRLAPVIAELLVEAVEIVAAVLFFGGLIITAFLLFITPYKTTLDVALACAAVGFVIDRCYRSYKADRNNETEEKSWNK